MAKVLFPLGQVVITPGAYFLLEDLNVDDDPLVARHQAGDWGCVSDDERRENRLAVRNGTRIRSAYEVGPTEEGGECHRIWIVTEADRSMTTVMLPSEYVLRLLDRF